MPRPSCSASIVDQPELVQHSQAVVVTAASGEPSLVRGRAVQHFHCPTEIALPTVSIEADGSVGCHVVADVRVARDGGDGYEIVWNRCRWCRLEWADRIRGRARQRFGVDYCGNRTFGGGHPPNAGDSEDDDHDCEPTPEHEHTVSVPMCAEREQA